MNVPIDISSAGEFETPPNVPAMEWIGDRANRLRHYIVNESAAANTNSAVLSIAQLQLLEIRPEYKFCKKLDKNKIEGLLKVGILDDMISIYQKL